MQDRRSLNYKSTTPVKAWVSIGPKLGVSGIRKMLGIKKRPLSLHIIKPKMGMTTEQTAEQVYKTALGGVDMVKNDEMTSDVYNSKFEPRLEAVLDALHRAKNKTDKEVIYFVSVTDEVNRVLDKARRAIKLGANGLLLAYSAGPRLSGYEPALNIILSQGRSTANTNEFDGFRWTSYMRNYIPHWSG